MDLDEYLDGYHGHLDRQRRPLTFREWGELRRDPTYATVARQRVGRQRVTTVWVGQTVRLTWNEEQPIFETFVVNRRGHARSVSHYVTEDEAAEGHRQVVASLEVARAATRQALWALLVVAAVVFLVVIANGG